MLNSEHLVRRIAHDLAMLPAHIAAIIKTAPFRYKTYYIPKRSGGEREVAQPAREVKAIQRWIVRELTNKLPVHTAATAYRTGSSIKSNAEVHAASRYMLKLDFTNFFPSIVREDVQQHLRQHLSVEWDDSACKMIAHACCWIRRRTPPLRLCIGAPSSPLISNSLLFEFDQALSTAAVDKGVAYTRYADDITLSCVETGKLDGFVQTVELLLSDLNYPRLTLNSGKTVFASRAEKRVVTGLVLTADGRVSLGRERKRLIRAMHHRKINGALGEDEVAKLAGLIAFAHGVEPDFVNRLQGGT